jgi:histidinol-phosphate aminotransferase
MDRKELHLLVRPNIRDLEPYRCARETVLEGVLLDANENPYPLIRHGAQVNRYPDPYQRALRRVLAKKLGIDPANVLAGSGSDEVLDWIFKVFCDGRKDSVAVAHPTYGMYEVMARIFDVPVFDFQLNQSFDFECDQFLCKVPENVNVLFLCSPNNPTGNLLNRNEIRKLLSNWSRIVVVDEAYLEFSGAESMLNELSEFPNLIIMRTFSKAYARAGLRLGYAVADEIFIDYFSRVKAPYNLNAMTQLEGVEALSSPAEDSRIGQITSERKRVEERLTALPEVRSVFPSDSNFLLFRTAGATAVCRQLLSEGIVVRDRSSLPGLTDCIRVTIGTSEENNLFLERLQHHLEAQNHG